MKVSDYVIKVLEKIDVKHVFGYQGANISHMIDSVFKNGNISFVESFNEQGSSFCANGYAQISNRLGVAMASSGPGAINLLSGIADAYFDSIPCLFITGNVGIAGMRNNRKIRQNSFQELDVVEMTKGITKYSCMIDDAEKTPEILIKAIKIAFDGRKGAVHIDIPHNIQKDYIPKELIKFPEFNITDIVVEEKIKEFTDCYINALNKSKRPLVLIGAGASKCIRKDKFMEFLDRLNIPYVASLKGLGYVDSGNHNYTGFIGDYGNRYANIAIYECDSLLILGSRLDHRQTGADLTKFAPNAVVYRVEIDEYEISRTDISTVIIQADLKDFIANMQEHDIKVECNWWKERINALKKKYPSYLSESEKVHVNTLFHYLSERLNKPYIVCADVGQTQMAVAQSFSIKRFGNLLNSGGLGAMGYALPCAIGARYASPNAIVIAIAGDGGIQMNLQELQMINRDKLNLKIIVVNNNCLGMIRQYQKVALDCRYYGSLIGYENPNFYGLAKAYDIDYLKIDSIKKYKDCLDYIYSNRSCLIEICTEEDINLLPEMGINILKQIPLQNYDLITKE